MSVDGHGDLIADGGVYDLCRRKVGAAVRERRKELGFSQEGFAQSARIDRARYGRIERGDMNLTLDTLCSLAAHLRTSPAQLLRHVTEIDCSDQLTTER